MSGNHKLYAGGEPPSQLDIEQMYSWSKHWNAGWLKEMQRHMEDNADGRMAQLCHEIHTQAFMDGFAAKLSGVKDE